MKNGQGLSLLKTLLVSSRNYMMLFRGRRRLRDVLDRSGVEIYVYDRCSLIDIDLKDAFFYVNSVSQLDEDARMCIKRGLRKGSIVIVEIVPRTRSDIVLVNKLVSQYGIEYTWLKVYDSTNNNGVPLNPLMDAYLPGRHLENIVVEHAFHIRAFRAYRFLRGKDTAIIMDPRTEEVLPVPSGRNVCSGTITYDNGKPQLIAFSGYVFSDTSLGSTMNYKLLELILSFIS